MSRRETVIQTFDLKPIEKCTLRKLVRRLKGSRTSGIDHIDSFSLKLAAPYVEDILQHLINLSLVQYPECWKTQLIHPFHKKGDKCVGGNYRPVSHISEVSGVARWGRFATPEPFSGNFGEICG